MTVPTDVAVGRSRDVPGFKEVWLAQSLSLFGHQITLLALPTLAILSLGASDAEVGVLRSLESLFFPLLALVVGVWADRTDPRRLLIAADALRLVALLSVPVAAAFAAVTMAQLYVVAAVVGIGWVLFNVPFMAYVPRLVPRPLLGRVNARLAVPQSVAEVAGPGVSALLVRAVGAANAVLLDVVTYAVSIVLLLRTPPRPSVAGPRPHILKDLVAGVRVVAASPVLRSVTGAVSAVNFAYGAVTTVLILFAYRELGMGPAEYGITLSIGSCGAVLGSLVASRVRTRLGYSGAMIASALVFSASFAALALAGLTSTPWGAGAVLAGAWFGVSAAMPVFDVAQVTVRQSVTPVELHGRVNAAVRTVVWGALPAGTAFGGWISELVSYEVALLLAAAVALLALKPTAWGVLRPIRTDDDLLAEAGANKERSAAMSGGTATSDEGTENR